MALSVKLGGDAVQPSTPRELFTMTSNCTSPAVRGGPRWQAVPCTRSGGFGLAAAGSDRQLAKIGQHF